MIETGTYELTKHENGSTTLALIPTQDVVTVQEPLDIIAALVTRRDASYPFPNWARDLAKIRWITVHHSAGSRATQHIQWWHRYHTRTKSWSRVGYHFGIAALEKGGEIELYQLNSLKWHTWHDARNFDTVGVCFSGDLRPNRDVEPNEVQCACFGRLMYHLLPQLPNLAGIVGHKHWQPTACPGAFETWKEKLVAAAAIHGVDIAKLVEARGKISRVGVGAFSVEALRGPLEADYDEDLGLCDVDGDVKGVRHTKIEPC